MDFCASPICLAVVRKEPWWNGRRLQLTWVGICTAILVCALIAFPIAMVLERRQASTAGPKLARLTAWLASATFSAGAAMFAPGMQDPDAILFGMPPATRAGVALWNMEPVLSLVLAALTVRAWRRKWWHLAGRVSLTLVCIAALGAALWIHHWDLFGWNY